MSKVLTICISKVSGDDMIEVETVNLIASKGIIEDRYFKENNEKDIQITLIEKENIDFYNQISNTDIPYINFRRNIITSGIKLNDLINKEILIGDTKIKAHRLCDPCKYLQDKLTQKSLVKNFINRGGLRCEVITSGKISVDDHIIVL
ncbi:MAG: hypothetical protein CFH17_01310 [Alphaproteobacteria bacterium MarineAlpha5_Bin7]|nr:MAG: hypothetical protein CFH17_01310 [Alphaproteobacteria bacterium MarineAlpha5_Bin7]|tara:strand:- start:482 stop:925 length:444 start_codon:yes stop_codon:yes gene_type:complete